MAVVQILVDGNGLLEQWPTLAPGKPRTSDVAREELFAQLTQYHDSTGIPINLIFVGPDTGALTSTPGVQVAFVPTLTTAANIMFRTITRTNGQGQVAAVIDNPADQTRLKSARGVVWSCVDFIHDVESALSELEQDLTNYNLNERQKFTNGGIA
jgi:predicted RNA-binding protein with PIN domain